MSRERVVNALSGLGLTRNEIEVYIFLAKQGPHEAHSITDALSVNEKDLIKSLINLKNKGMVRIISEITPTHFFAIPFEKAVDLLVDANLKQAQFAQRSKKVVGRYWDSMLKENEKDVE
jgi:sugar-specific transcriptional regulator TrmB